MTYQTHLSVEWLFPVDFRVFRLLWMLSVLALAGTKLCCFVLLLLRSIYAIHGITVFKFLFIIYSGYVLH